jgi:hypothetical protein
MASTLASGDVLQLPFERLIGYRTALFGRTLADFAIGGGQTVLSGDRGGR